MLLHFDQEQNTRTSKSFLINRLIKFSQPKIIHPEFVRKTSVFLLLKNDVSFHRDKKKVMDA